jgi:hypothetical protein
LNNLPPCETELFAAFRAVPFLRGQAAARSDVPNRPVLRPAMAVLRTLVQAEAQGCYSYVMPIMVFAIVLIMSVRRRRNGRQ